jgi:alpha-L-fucosidase
MNTDKTTLETETQPSCLGAVMRSCIHCGNKDQSKFEVWEELDYNDFLNKFITNNNEESEYYYIQAKNNGEWKNLTSATTIGHKRIVYFPTTTAKELRIVFDEAFAKPIISNVALYNTPDK